ncbi:MAG: ABC transporter substrate-binding protein [Deltaproteobacteria bacterium]|nr:ABC transporter substrate-binding protein [Deltaproteobacteria bacterium]MBW1927655.1 ABC transporter substrate-binding protein [Deltaproteobacteria bacterium]MBW2026257.1 ABC transporter substrate-binding protein [Deltaproteobacteria bacterium]MBW2126169.1 ABC transporter substrate-binding protein [Deltaproteobacteria bacterium]
MIYSSIFQKQMGKGILGALVGLLLLVFLAPTPPVKAEDKVIRLLGTVSQSGAAGNIGPAYDRAMRLAVKEINAAGIRGFSRVEYKVIDIETKPSVFSRKLRREVQIWKPDIAAGAALETTIRVPCKEAPKYKLPYFIGGHLSVTKYMPPGNVPVSKWVAYYGYASFFAGQLAGKFFHEMGAKRVAFLGGDYDWGYSNSLGLKDYWEKHGRPFEIVPVLYTPLDKTDYSTEVQIIKDAKPDALFCPYSGAGWFSAAKQLAAAGAKPKYFLYGTTYSNMGGAKITGVKGARNIYTLADHDPGSAAWKEFVKKWKAEYGKDAYPEAYTNNYYQAVYWAIKAFEIAGTKDHEKVMDTMLKTSFQNVCISPMGPLGPFGSNMGARAGIVKFEPGAGELDPSFGLHPVLVRIFTTPKMNIKQVMAQIKGKERLMQGKTYPRGK